MAGHGHVDDHEPAPDPTDLSVRSAKVPKPSINLVAVVYIPLREL